MKSEEFLIAKKNIQTLRSQIINEITDWGDHRLILLEKLNEFDKRRKLLNDSKKFYGEIKGNIIHLGSKGLKYWPKSILELVEVNENETQIKIEYKLFYPYLIFYTFLVISFLFYFINPGAENEIEAMCIFGTIFIILPIYTRWTQKNLIDFLIN